MTSRLETISRISDEAKDDIKCTLLSEHDDFNLSEVGFQLSSYFDLAVVWRNAKALILLPKFINDPKRPDNPHMMTLNSGKEINCLKGDITDVCILPMMSTKRADCGQPEIAIICVAVSSGHFIFYLETGVVLIDYQLHLSPVVSIRFRGFSGGQPETTLTIVHSDCIIEIDGMELYQMLRVARVSPDQVNKSELKSRKYTFEKSNEVSEAVSLGKYTITRWEQYVNASAYGPNERVSPNIPSYNSYTTAGKNYVQFYHHIDSVGQSAISSALSIGKSLMKKSTGWFFGAAQPEPEPEIKIDRGTEITPRSTLLDQRVGVRIEAAPYGLPFAAFSDNLGRVSIVETNKMTILRLIKGVRDCQMSWLRSSDESRNALFLVILDRLGSLSVYSVHHGPRVATWNVGKGAQLLSHTHQVGVNNSNLKSMSPSNYQTAVITSDGELKRVCVPLHLALSDHNSPRLADVATLRELSKQLKKSNVDFDQIKALVIRLRLSNTQRQATEKIIASEKISLDDVEKFMETFGEKSKNEKLSGHKEAKEFQFWHQRLKKMIDAYKMITLSESAIEPVVDPDCIFTNEAEDDIKCIFDTKKQISETRMSKVQFSGGTSSINYLTLYDFTRCFVEDKGAFTLHSSISDIRKKHLAARIFESSELPQIVDKLVLPLVDYLELLKCHVASVNCSFSTVTHFLRLIQTTSSIFNETLPLDWLQGLRDECLKMQPSNGLLFVYVLEFFRKSCQSDDSEIQDWGNLVIDNQWKEVTECLRIAAALDILSDGDITGQTLQLGGIGGITEAVAEWLVKNRLQLTSEIHPTPKIAMAQMFLKNYLVPYFPSSLSNDLVNSSVFWTASSQWASSTGKTVCDQLLPLVLQSLNEIKDAHLAAGAAMFTWKTLLSSMFEATVSEIASKKNRAALSSKTAPKRSKGPAKIEQTLEIIANLLDTLITNDPDATPPPDVTTDLSKINLLENRKPSVCEIILNQELPNPQLIRLHSTLLRCCRLTTSLNVKFEIKKLFSESEVNAFFGPLSRAWSQKSVPSSTIDGRREFIVLLLETLCLQTAKNKHPSASVEVYRVEIRRLASDWELDCETEVDIPVLVKAYRSIFILPSPNFISNILLYLTRQYN